MPRAHTAAPRVAELWERWKSLETATASRPPSVEECKTEAVAELRELEQDSWRIAQGIALLPAGHDLGGREHLAHLNKHTQHALGAVLAFDDPEHPAAVAVRLWERQNPHHDVTARIVRRQLESAVREASTGLGRDWMAALPPIIERDSFELWVRAGASQLSYRERYGVTATSPLGVEPWSEPQITEFNEAAVLLERVHIDVARRAAVTVEAKLVNRQMPGIELA